MQKGMDNLVDRATTAEKNSLHAYTMLSSLSSGIEDQKKLKDQMASLMQKNTELEEAAAAAQQQMKQSQDLAGKQAVGLAAAAKQDKASRSKFALIATDGPCGPDQVSDDRIAELQGDKKLLQEEKAKLEAALQTANKESTKQRAEDIKNANFLRKGLKEMTEKHEEEMKLKARQIRVDLLRVCPENASARCQDEARMSCRVLRESLDKSQESEKKHKALVSALEKDILVKLGKEDRAKATIKKLQSELAVSKTAEADAEATTKHLRSELLAATARSAELLMEEETMSCKLLEQGLEYMKMESQDALRSEMKMLQEEMLAMNFSQRTAAPKEGQSDQVIPVQEDTDLLAVCMSDINTCTDLLPRVAFDL
ncbi:unnamed protein product, partial [Symbiodinium sp. CCMP2456]